MRVRVPLPVPRCRDRRVRVAVPDLARFLSGVRCRAPTCPRPSTMMPEYDYFPDHFHDTDKRRCPGSATTTSTTTTTSSTDRRRRFRTLVHPIRRTDPNPNPTYFIKCHLSCAYRIIITCVASLGFAGVANHLNNSIWNVWGNKYIMPYSI